MAKKRSELSPREERVEYQLSPDYIPSWGVVEMLREVIANALDTDAPYTISYNGGTNTVCVTDQGPGFVKRFLMMGGGEQKTSRQIGQFKEGLKLAMLVAARKKLAFRLETTEFIVTRVAIEKTQLGGDGLVIYLAPPTGKKGTRIVTEATQAQYDRAVQLFACAKADGCTLKRAPIPDPTKDHVWLEAKGVKPSVYINGLFVQHTSTLFSFNLTGVDMKESQNRDRNKISWTDVRGRARKLVLGIKDPVMLDAIVEASLDRKSNVVVDDDDDILDDDDFTGEEETREVKYDDLAMWWNTKPAYPGLWEKAIERVVQKLKLQNKKSSVLKLCANFSGCDAEHILVAQEAGWTVLTFNGGAANLLRGMIPPVKEASKRSATDRAIEPVLAKNQTPVETYNLQFLRDMIQPFFPGLKFPEFRVFSIGYDDDRAEGYWYQGKVWIKRDVINEPITTRNVRRLTEIALHELSHWKSGAGDRTRHFEHEMGDFAAGLICRAPENRVRMEQLTKTDDSWRADIEALPQLTLAEIQAAEGFTLDQICKTPRKKMEATPTGWRRVFFWYGNAMEPTDRRWAKVRRDHHYVAMLPDRVMLLTIDRRSNEFRNATINRVVWDGYARPNIVPFFEDDTPQVKPKAQTRAAASTKE